MAKSIMPNKIPSTTNENSAVEAFFDQFRKRLTEFAEKHNLLVEKCWHNFPSWRFSFRHPVHGIACIEIMKEGAALKAYGYWWIDNYDQGTRHGRRYESKNLNVVDLNIEELLGSLSKEIVSWTPDSLTLDGAGFGPSWRQAFTREQFEDSGNAYPVLRSSS